MRLVWGMVLLLCLTGCSASRAGGSQTAVSPSSESAVVVPPGRAMKTYSGGGG